MIFDIKLIFGLIPAVIAVANLYIYMKSVFKGSTKPHFFTWFIWGLISAVIFAGQYAENAGYGMLLAAFSTFNCFCRAAAALKYGEKTITPMDKACLAACIFAIILWPIVKAPLWSVIIVTLIDLVAFLPTYRKSWNKPHQENITSYFLFGCSAFCAIIAMQTYNVTNVIYPISVIISCWGFVWILALRRQALGMKIFP